MRDDITLSLHLSLAEPIPRMTPVLVLTEGLCDKKVFVFHEEGFQLPTPSQSREIMGNLECKHFYVFRNQFSTRINFKLGYRSFQRTKNWPEPVFGHINVKHRVRIIVNRTFLLHRNNCVKNLNKFLVSTFKMPRGIPYSWLPCVCRRALFSLIICCSLQRHILNSTAVFLSTIRLLCQFRFVFKMFVVL